jgi:hypothetical protein
MIDFVRKYGDEPYEIEVSRSWHMQMMNEIPFVNDYSDNDVRFETEGRFCGIPYKVVGEGDTCKIKAGPPGRKGDK